MISDKEIAALKMKLLNPRGTIDERMDALESLCRERAELLAIANLASNVTAQTRLVPHSQFERLRELVIAYFAPRPATDEGSGK